MMDKVDLARRTLKACDDFRQAALDADQAMSRSNGQATKAVWDSILSLVRKASTLDGLSEKLAGCVLGDQ